MDNGSRDVCERSGKIGHQLFPEGIVFHDSPEKEIFVHLECVLEAADLAFENHAHFHLIAMGESEPDHIHVEIFLISFRCGIPPELPLDCWSLKESRFTHTQSSG